MQLCGCTKVAVTKRRHCAAFYCICKFVIRFWKRLCSKLKQASDICWPKKKNISLWYGWGDRVGLSRLYMLSFCICLIDFLLWRNVTRHLLAKNATTQSFVSYIWWVMCMRIIIYLTNGEHILTISETGNPQNTLQQSIYRFANIRVANTNETRANRVWCV